MAAGVWSKALGAVTVVDETHGFRFFENRDLLGFVDGTENPDGPLAVSATEIGDEDPDFAGGCYVHVQKYLHDMTSWESLSVTEQELVIGRTKLEDIEMDDDVKPANAHIALNVIEDDDGNELKIVRHNMPFGEISHHKNLGDPDWEYYDRTYYALGYAFEHRLNDTWQFKQNLRYTKSDLSFQALTPGSYPFTQMDDQGNIGRSSTIVDEDIIEDHHAQAEHDQLADVSHV